MKKNISIHFDCGDKLGALAMRSRIFRNWFKSVDKRFKISSLTITAVDYHASKTAKKVLFVRLRVATATTPYEQIVELRGNTAVMLVNLACYEDLSIYTVLVQQPRVATGKYDLVEIPAGMIDEGSFAGAASREIKEELGLKFAASELKDITGIPRSKGGIYLSPGLLDEACRFYLAERKVTWAELQKLRGQTHGVASEGEKITLMIVPLRDIPKVSQDAKALLALSLYDRYGECIN